MDKAEMRWLEVRPKAGWGGGGSSEGINGNADALDVVAEGGEFNPKSEVKRFLAMRRRF